MLYPEIRVDFIQNNGDLSLKFTHKMQFPDDIADLIIGRKLYPEKLIEIIMINGDTEEIDENLVSWFVTSASATNIDIRTEYEKPLFVSTGYAPDFLIL